MKRNKLIVTFLSTAAMTFSLASCGQLPPAPVHVESVELNLHQKDVFVGDSFDLTYVINPENADNKNVTWVSTVPEVASVDNGHVLALQAGTTTVAVITEDGNKRDECVVNVGKHVESVSLREHEKFVAIEDEFTVGYTILPSDAADQRVQWSSDDITVATVNGGTIKAVGAGQATITILTVDGARSDTVVVNVAAAQPKIVLDKDSVVETADNGAINQVKVEDQVFDLVGWEAASNALGKIKKATHGQYVYNGMIYNRSLLKGLKSVTVDYSGDSDHLFIVWSNYLMENMDFNGVKVADRVEMPADGATYFILYNDSESPATINSITLKYDAEDTTDLKMIYNKNTTMGGARSLAKTTIKKDSYVELENNPTKTTNNYSVGKSSGHTNNDAWYRWNGRYFDPSEDLGTEFTFNMTLGVSYDRMINANKNFHINVWPQFSYGNESDRPWMQTYIGNDNYEPLGPEHKMHPTDVYADNSFTGRFFTNYDWYNAHWQVDYEDTTGAWLFADPDKVMIPDEQNHLTMRQAYEQYTLPFWFCEFHVYLDADNDPMIDIKINGMLIYRSWMFEDYDKVNTPSIHLHTLPMHLVNYGIDAEGNPDESYTGIFTYPRLDA